MRDGLKNRVNGNQYYLENNTLSQILSKEGISKLTFNVRMTPDINYCPPRGNCEDHSIPFVQVNLWYDVGSKDEVEGRTGFAHLFEHLMFQGSHHHDQDYVTPLQLIGGEMNGTTSFDQTTD